MAPRKSKRDDSVDTPKVDAVTNQTVTRRVTRSSSLAASTGAVAAPAVSVPVKQPAKKKAKKSSKKEEVKEEEEEEVKVEDKPEEDEANEPEESKDTEKDDNFTKTIIIEHCKQCRCFKKSADEVKTGLEAGVSGVKVVINPEKPRRGCFEVREEGGEAFITLLDLKRPFKKLKDLDMDEVISDIVGKIK